MRRARQAVLSVSLVLVACGGPPPEEVRSRTSAILADFVREAGDSAEAAKALESIKLFGDGLSALGLGTADAPAPWPGSGSGSATSSSSDLRESAAEAAARLDELLGRYLFNDENLESSSLGETTFLIRGAVVCGAVTTKVCGGSGGSFTCQESSSSRESCLQAVDRLQLRIVASLVGDGVDLELRVGGSGTIVLLQLRRDQLTAKLYLGAARDAAQAIGALLGEELPTLPELARGVVALTLKRNAPRDLTASASIVEAIEVGGTAAGGVYRVASEARDPLLALRFQAASSTLSLSIDAGASELAGPARLLFAKAAAKQQLKALLAGWTGTFTASPAEGIAFKGIGLGAGRSSVSLDGVELWASELNSDAGGRFDLEVEPIQGMPRCTFSPRLELAVTLNLAPVQSWLDETLPPWARSERYRLSLSDPGNRPQVLPVAARAGFPGGLKVLRGTLTLRAELTPAAITVNAGQCLAVNESAAPGSHPLLGLLSVVPCP
jgi:hypothetical protein